MKPSSLFVLGLVLGGLVVFGVRAASLEDESTGTSGEPTAGESGTPPASAHAGHPAPAASPEPEPTPSTSGGVGERVDDAKPPENAICPVMGNEVDPDVYVDYEGRRIGFCCPGCDKAFLEAPEKYLKKVDAELARRAADHAGHEESDPGDAADEDRSPENEICPVMGNPVDPEVWVDYEGRRIGFCCPGCDRVFLEEPEKYLKKVDAELERRAKK